MGIYLVYVSDDHINMEVIIESVIIINLFSSLL